ncbi:hypothetical protein GUJ93_ZPchr0013g35119 [Zizania palustris]|uniref:Uncharacterized protein n=1 Tax=Zizania palustris TaxID=103762 RepID=A0A8J5X3V0_ZIZPA|nr:hypothetical protein GUJ93_ZPchr0013g35119 [Zizania palustris]
MAREWHTSSRRPGHIMRCRGGLRVTANGQLRVDLPIDPLSRSVGVGMFGAFADMRCPILVLDGVVCARIGARLLILAILGSSLIGAPYLQVAEPIVQEAT